MDEKHKVGAHQLEGKYDHLNDKEPRFRRVKVLEPDQRPITPVTLYSRLEDGNNTVVGGSSILRIAMGCEFELTTYRGWTDASSGQSPSSAANTSL